MAEKRISEELKLDVNRIKQDYYNKTTSSKAPESDERQQEHSSLLQDEGKIEKDEIREAFDGI